MTIAPSFTADSTYALALESTHVENPLAGLREVVIPKGAVIKSFEPGATPKSAGRTYKVKVRSMFYGHVDTVENIGQAQLPTITWLGRGGFWYDAQVTPELAAANGVTLADFTTTEEQAQLLGLPNLPSWEAGSTNRWSIES